MGKHYDLREGFVPNMFELKKDILVESHGSPYFVQLGSMKMYRDL